MLHSAELSQNFHFLAKRKQLGFSLFDKKAKVWVTLHLTWQVLLSHMNPKNAFQEQNTSALIWFGLLG